MIEDQDTKRNRLSRCSSLEQFTEIFDVQTLIGSRYDARGGQDVLAAKQLMDVTSIPRCYLIGLLALVERQPSWSPWPAIRSSDAEPAVTSSLIGGARRSASPVKSDPLPHLRYLRFALLTVGYRLVE